jgi:hypothetical protein
VGPVTGQTPQIQKKVQNALKEAKAKAAEPSLAQLLEQALQNNPDIQAAEAQVHEAEAKLNQVRLKTLSKVTSQYQEIRAQQAVSREAEQRHERIRRLRESNAVSMEEVASSEVNLQKAKADLARAEAELPYLIGQAPRTGKDDEWPEVKLPNGNLIRLAPYYYQAALLHAASKKKGGPPEPVTLPAGHAEGLRKLLDKKFHGQFGPFTLDELLSRVLRAEVQGAGVNINVQLQPANTEGKHAANFEDGVSLGGLFQWIEDQYHVHCVVRDYGIVITDHPPPGAVMLLDLWRQRPEKNTMP